MINTARLQNFRSYRDQGFEFSDRVNIIVGPNASGKTNLLEAVAVLATGSSFRTKDSELISTGKTWARLDGEFDDEKRIVKLDSSKETFLKTVEINAKSYRRLNFAHTRPLIYFEPSQLNLITSGPAERRQVIDELLSQSQADFRTAVAGYRRTLAQRNSLLKKPPATIKEQIFAWNIRLAELASQVAAARQDLTTYLNSHIGEAYSKIAKKKTQVHLGYQPMFPVASYASSMLARLERDLQLDVLRGFTAAGPHREDFVFTLNAQPLSTVASRGEVRSLFLALKNVELKLVEEARGAKPILLLDDVFSELDGARRKALVSTLKNYQTIITTTDADSVLDFFSGAEHRLIALSGRRPRQA